MAQSVALRAATPVTGFESRYIPPFFVFFCFFFVFFLYNFAQLCIRQSAYSVILNHLQTYNANVSLDLAKVIKVLALAVARKPRDAAAVLLVLNFADNIHYKFKVAKLRKSGFRARVKCFKKHVFALKEERRDEVLL